MIKQVNFIFFFFQAEDGIRDATVTGVQTCALPISTPTLERSPHRNHPRQPAPHRSPDLGGGRPLGSEYLPHPPCARARRLPRLSRRTLRIPHYPRSHSKRHERPRP